MQFCIYSSYIGPKIKFDDGSVKWTKLADNADASINTCTCIDLIKALKYNLVDLCKYSISFAIRMTLNCKKSKKITF